MDKKFGLVLEGGGFRGCYTAGALKWLYEHDIRFSYSASISVASVHAFCYATGRMEEMERIAIDGVLEKNFIGIVPLIREGGLCGLNAMKEKYLKPFAGEALKDLKNSDRDCEIGLYNMSEQKLQYFGKEYFDDEGEYLKASCVLPISGKMTVLNGQKFLDGGIESMVSINRSIETGHTKHLVIVTKDKNYVRKPNNFFLANALRIIYHKYKTMLKTLDGRVDSYYREMNQVYQMEQEGTAILVRPSKDCGVGRFSGNKQQLEEMYQLGYDDMEAIKDKLYEFLEIKEK